MHSSIWLTLLIVLPIVGALVAALTAKVEGRAYVVAVATSGVELVLALIVACLYNDHIAKAQTFDFATRHVLSAPFGLAYDVALDGISLLMVVLTALVVLLALLGARDRRQEPAFVAWLLLLTSFTMGSFLSHDLLEFFIFFELTLIPCYFIISQWGGKERSKAALKFFIYTFTGSAFLLIGILYLGFAHQHQNPTSALSFSYSVLSGTSMSHGTAVWLFIAFAIAFAVKAPIWPLHTWSPITYAEAPTAGSIEMSALLAKLGTYGLLRFAVGLFPLALPTMRPVLLTLAVIGILYGSMLRVRDAGLEAVRRVLLARPDGFHHVGRHVRLDHWHRRRGAVDVQPRRHHDRLLPHHRLHRATTREHPDQGLPWAPGSGADHGGALHGRDARLHWTARPLGLRQ